MSYTQDIRTIKTRTCEVCGTVFMAGYGYSIMASWVVTGHAHVGAFSCAQALPGNQHWGCTPEHAKMALIACLEHDDHLSVNNLKAKHQAAEANGLPRISIEHQHLVDQYGEDFHILKKGETP